MLKDGVNSVKYQTKIS